MLNTTTKPTESKCDVPSPRNTISCGTALDEAFAVLSDLDIRVDAGQSASESTPEWAKQAAPLIEKINEQMISLEEQRQRLSRLLVELAESESV